MLNFFVVIRILVDKIDQGTKKNGVCLSATGGCIYQATFKITDMLPGLFLEKKGLKLFASSQLLIIA
jgi:hypothetical protein